MASNVEIIVGATVDGALGGLRAVSGAIDNLQPAAAAIGKIGKAAFAAFAAGIGAAATALTYFASEASKAEQVNVLFDAVFDSASASQFTEEVTTVTKEIEKYYNKLGQARYRVNYITETTTAVRGLDEAFKSTIESVVDAASQITRFDSGTITSAATELLRYGEIGQDVFTQTLEASLDLAEVMKTDPVAAAETLGRALSDIADGSLRTLEKQGLLTDAEREFAENLAETGDAAAAQAYILDILNGKIGNVAETMGQTFSGQLTILKNNLGNLAEELGGKLLPVLTPVVEKFAELVDKYGPLISNLFDKTIVPGIQRAVTAFLSFIDTLTSGEFNLEDWLLGLDFGAISEDIIAAIESVDWNAMGETLGHWLGVAFEVAKNIATQTDWGGLFSSLGQAIADFATGLGGGDWAEFLAVWESNFAQLGAIVDNVVRIIREKISQFSLADAAAAMMGGFAVSIAFASVKVLASITNIVAQIVRIFRSKLSEFRNIGKAIVDGLRLGIESNFSAFSSWLSGIVQSIIDSVLGTLGISSPSKVFADIGKQMMAGMAQGIGRNAEMPIGSMQMATANVVGAAQVQNNYYYGRILMQRGEEGRLLNTLLE